MGNGKKAATELSYEVSQNREIELLLYNEVELTDNFECKSFGYEYHEGCLHSNGN